MPEHDETAEQASRTLSNEDILTTRRVPRRSFLTAAGGVLLGAAALAVGVNAQGSDPDKKKTAPRDKKKAAADPDKKKEASDPDKKKVVRAASEKGSDPDRKKHGKAKTAKKKKSGSDPDPR